MIFFYIIKTRFVLYLKSAEFKRMSADYKRNIPKI